MCFFNKYLRYRRSLKIEGGQRKEKGKRSEIRRERESVIEKVSYGGESRLKDFYSSDLTSKDFKRICFTLGTNLKGIFCVENKCVFLISRKDKKRIKNFGPAPSIPYSSLKNSFRIQKKSEGKFVREDRNS